MVSQSLLLACLLAATSRNGACAWTSLVKPPTDPTAAGLALSLGGNFWWWHRQASFSPTEKARIAYTIQKSQVRRFAESNSCGFVSYANSSAEAKSRITRNGSDCFLEVCPFSDSVPNGADADHFIGTPRPGQNTTASAPIAFSNNNSNAGTKWILDETPRPPFVLQRRVIAHSPDQVAATTLGDIMSMGLITGNVGSSSLAASASAASGSLIGNRSGAAMASSQEESLAERYGIDHPLDRMALTANGNLQRLVCSYYDSPVSVTLDSQHRSDPPTMMTPVGNAGSVSQVWHRVVHLSVFQKTFCTATSVITVHDPACQALVESGRVGLGQLFRYLDLLPEFTLLGAGKFPAATTASPSGEREEKGTTTRGKVHLQSGGGNFWREYRLDCNELSCSIREEFCTRLWDLWPGPEV
jgi:hypothetical protein